MKRIGNKFLKRVLVLSFSALILGIGNIAAQPLPPPSGGAPSLPPPEAAPLPQAVQPGPTPPGPGTPPPPSPGTPLPPAPVSPPSPAPAPPPGWGASGFLPNPPEPDFNQGTINVMATGYDTESVLVQIPLVVSYSFNGVNYNVTVLNSWNPYTQTWTMGIDIPAYQTSYYFNGFTYNYYASLPSGTFYFNL